MDKSKKKIAIIEDDEAIREMYALKLVNEGYDVKSAINGVDGLKLVEQFKPDVILLDLMLPQMNGDELLKKVRATDWGKNIKVIVLTNISAEEAPATLKELGVSQYVIKANHTPTQVIQMVNKILSN